MKYLVGLFLVAALLSPSVGAKAMRCDSEMTVQSNRQTVAASREPLPKEAVCPVTRTKLDPAKAYSKTAYKGKTYYFCCAGCPEKFNKNPSKYIKK